MLPLQNPVLVLMMLLLLMMRMVMMMLMTVMMKKKMKDYAQGGGYAVIDYVHLRLFCVGQAQHCHRHSCSTAVVIATITYC